MQAQMPVFESARSFHELYPKLLDLVLDSGQLVAPRGQPTYEIAPLTFLLEDPTDSITLQRARRINYAYAIVEKLSLVYGAAEPDAFCFYIPSLRRLLDDDGVFGGAYGPRVTGQLDYVYHVLRDDPDSRRAVITVFTTGQARMYRAH